MIENLSSLSLEDKVGQLFFIGIPGPIIDDATKSILADISPGGICLFARNIREAGQTRDLLDDIRYGLPVQPLLSIDQEGGLVDRLRRIMSPMPAAHKLRTPSDAARLAEIIAETLRILGFNMNFAPVVDVMNGNRGKFSNGLFSRTYGDSAEDAATFGEAFLTALQENGIVGCLKHFPGLGASRVDSHNELPMVEISENEMYSVDLAPYRELLTKKKVHAIMVAHASYPHLRLQEFDQNGKLLPSSLSNNIITKLLRGDLGFDELVITDDLEMGAIVNGYGVGEACAMAIGAGVDMLAICADPDAIRSGYDAVLDAVTKGEISLDRIDESLTRIARVKGLLKNPPGFDVDRLDHLSRAIAEIDGRLSS